MPFVIADRVRETTTTTGTGAVTLAGAYTSFQTFSAAIGNGNNTYYTIASAVSGEWEVGIGTYTSAGNTLSRDTVLASSNAGALVVFSAGTKDVFVTQPASRAIFVQNGGTGLQTGNSAFTANRVLYANAATTTATSANLTFDGTTLTANTLTVTNNPTFSAGTANGVLYLDGSKVATSGSAVTYNGTTFALGAAWTTNPLAGASAPLFYQYGSGGSAIRVIGDGGAGTLSAFRFDNGASPAICLLGKARGTYASSSAVQTGDYLGEIRMNGYGGTTSRNLVNILGGVETYTSDTDIATFFEFRTSSSGSASATEKMRLTAAGNLGIGTTSPANRLDVFASADWQGRVVGNAGFNGGLIVEGNATGTRAQINLKTNNATAREYYLRNVSGTFSLLDNTAGTIPLTVEAATPSNTIYANASGNLGIGTTSPSGRLHISTASGNTDFYHNVTGAGTAARTTYTRGGTVQFYAGLGAWSGTDTYQIAGASGPLTTLDSSGNLGIGATSPAAKLDVVGSLGIRVNEDGAGTKVIQIRSNFAGVGPAINVSTNDPLLLQTNNTERARITSTGVFCLGATSNTGRGGSNTTALFYKASGTQYVDIQTGSSGDSGLIFSGSSTSAYGLINYSTASNSMLFYANSAEVFRIDSGNMGIGATSPVSKLDVRGVISGGDGTIRTVISYTASAGVTGTLTNHPYVLYSNNAEAARFDTSGNFGITQGNNPTQALNIYRSGSTQTVMSAGNSNTGLNGTYFGVDTTGNGIVNTTGAFATIFSNNASERARITSAGDMGIGTTSPGYRLEVYKTDPTANRTNPLDVMAITANNGNAPYDGFGPGLLFKSSTYVYPTPREVARIRSKLNDNSVVNYGSSLVFDVTPLNSSSPTQAMELSYAGNLGLGVVPSASTIAQFEGGSNLILVGRGNVYASNNATFNSGWKYISTAVAAQYNISGAEHRWFNAASGTAGNTISFTQAMTLDASGNLLVGTTSTSPSSNVGVKIYPDGRVYGVSASSANTSESYGMYSTGAAAYRFYVGWGGTVYATSTTISAISDRRLKENIRDLDAGLDAIMALKPRKFDWKEGKGKDIKNDRGFIAQEFEQVFPDLIDTWKDPAPKGEEPYKAVRADLIPVLVKAMQEQQAMIETLKAEVAALKGA